VSNGWNFKLILLVKTSLSWCQLLNNETYQVEILFKNIS
jgi:hypothetical protein